MTGVQTCALPIFAKTTGYAGTRPRVLQVDVTTGGVTAVAVVDVTAPAIGDQAAISELTQTVTDAGTLELGESGQITVTARKRVVEGKGVDARGGRTRRRKNVDAR